MRLACSLWLAIWVLSVGARGVSFGEKPEDTALGTPLGEIPQGAADLLTDETQKAIHLALEWLATNQSADGSFGTGTYRGNVAVTSLAALAFMSAGSSPGRGLYGQQIDKALQYVLSNVSPSGLAHAMTAGFNAPMYSHGFGTLFLAEAYGMTHQPEIRDKLTKAVKLIVDTQAKEGGWRYQPVPNDADLSVTICQINALRAARNAGVFVPKETVDRCIGYVKKSQNADGSFRYVLQGGYGSRALTAAGIVALFSAGDYSSEEVQKALKALNNQADPSHYFYTMYYVAQALWTAGGKKWNDWYSEASKTLLKQKGTSIHWSGDGCDHYATAMALLVLQMPNNLLPIFQR